jgi:hypothetical protein
MADPNQQAAEKLDKETKKVQAEQAANAQKTWENMQKGKTMPTENDMGPLPTKPAKKFKKGGSASARADGCCIRGKTRA